MKNTITPEELMGEAEVSVPETSEFSELLAFCRRCLTENKDALARGQTLRAMVSASTSREDVALACKIFWREGWQVSYLSCEPRPHQLFFSVPNFVGMGSRGFPSIH